MQEHYYPLLFFCVCCISGTIRIPEVPHYFHELHYLLVLDSQDENTFQKIFGASSLAMCSVQVHDATVHRGLSNYRMQGVVYTIFGQPRYAAAYKLTSTILKNKLGSVCKGCQQCMEEITLVILFVRHNCGKQHFFLHFSTKL